MAVFDTVHLELTHRCNAACPLCARTQNAALPLPPAELRLEDVQRILPPALLASRVRRVFACGNFGDPALATDALDIFAWLRAVAPPTLRLGLHTNGGVGHPDAWWRALGAILRAPSYARFAIDGLEGTNHLYRRGVRWQAVMRAVRAFVAGGGNAQWDFIAFAHNEHEIEDARGVACSMGFSLFNVKRSARFVDSRTGAMRAQLDDGRLRPPASAALQNRATLEGLQRIAARFPGGLPEFYAQHAQIECRAARDRQVYVSALGEVWPCCWLAGEEFGASAGGETMRLRDACGGGLATSALAQPLETVVAESAFFRAVAASWATRRLPLCARTCYVAPADLGGGDWWAEQSALNRQPPPPPQRARRRRTPIPTALLLLLCVLLLYVLLLLLTFASTTAKTTMTTTTTTTRTPR